MNNTGMPVYRPTADCIWNSFRSSHKKHIILTGSRRCGKTTLLNALFPQGLPGITTWAEPGQGVYLRDNQTGTVVQAGYYDPSLPGTENKMKLCGNAFPNDGVPSLMRCCHSDSEWISIDEIGYLECSCPSYCEAILKLMEKKHLIAAVRKQELPFLEMLCSHEDSFVLDLDAPFGNYGCVIMASGMGKRFGSNKLLADFHGKPMISWILSATDGLFSKRVVVTRHPEIAALCRNHQIETVLHNFPARSDTVRLGIQAIGETDGCMFCSGDQPLLSRETVAGLLLAAVNHPNVIWRTCFENTPASPVLFPTRFFPELLSLPQGKGGSYVANQYPDLVRFLPAADPQELKDVDTPEDLAELLGNK